MARHFAHMLGHFNDLSEPQMQALAIALGKDLSAGDTVLLNGPVGAGKTTFARSVIQSLLLEAEDIPSPTFTLVQTYETTAGPLWHCDLYRLSDVSELEELGLTEAFETAVCLIEWPDILGETAPKDALRLSLEPNADGSARSITASSEAARWSSLKAFSP